jgi:hypothetical protein
MSPASAGANSQTASVMGPRAAKKTLLAKQVLPELNSGGRVSRETQLGVEDAARDAALQKEEKRCVMADAQAPSLWQRLLDFLGLGGRKEKASSGLDRPALIQKLRELILRMHSTDVAARLSVLSDIWARKQELFGDLFAAGSPRLDLERLGQKLLHVEGVLDASHSDASVGAIWAGLLAALTDLLLALEAEDAASPRREGFWK